MKIATWNVNGIRARESQLAVWVAREQPDVLCLQEIKATPEQVPASVAEMAGYWCTWHGSKGYSGVGLHVREGLGAARPAIVHPPFDYECRIATAEVQGVTVASVYVPNGGKDLPAKMRFLEALRAWAEEAHAAGRPIVVCGDMNVARADIDVHPKERKARPVVGYLPEERELFERLLSHGLVDVGRQLYPDDEGLFTWWAPWRNLRQRNIGWRIDYVLVSEPLATRVKSFRVDREFGTSDHAPVVVEIE